MYVVGEEEICDGDGGGGAACGVDVDKNGEDARCWVEADVVGEGQSEDGGGGGDSGYFSKGRKDGCGGCPTWEGEVLDDGVGIGGLFLGVDGEGVGSEIVVGPSADEVMDFYVVPGVVFVDEEGNGSCVGIAALVAPNREIKPVGGRCLEGGSG